MRKIHHVRRVAARRTHVDLQGDKIPNLAEVRPRLREAEKLKVDKAAAHAEGLDRRTSALAQLRRQLVEHIIGKLLVLVDDVCDGRRKGRRGLKQRLTVGVYDRVIGVNVAEDKFLHHIGHVRLDTEKLLQIRVALQLPGVCRADADVGLDDHGIAADLAQKSFRCGLIRHAVGAGGGHAGGGIECLHAGLVLPGGDLRRQHTGDDVKILAQAGILLQPVFVVGLEPIDAPVLEREERHRAVHLVIILHRIHAVILRQRVAQRLLQRVVGRVADTQHVDPVSLQPVAKLPVGMGKMRGNEDKIHKNTPLRG